MPTEVETITQLLISILLQLPKLEREEISKHLVGLSKDTDNKKATSLVWLFLLYQNTCIKVKIRLDGA